MTMLLVLLLQSTALLSLGLLALRLTRRFGPSVQSLVGRASLVGVALLLLLAPLTGHVRPVVRVRLPQKVEPTPQQPAPLPKREGKEAPPPFSPLHSYEGQFGRAIQKDAAPKEAVPKEAVPKEAGLGQISATRQEGMAGNGFPPVQSPLSISNPSFRKDPVIRSNASGHTEERGNKAVGLLSLLLLLWLAICQWHLTRLRRTAQLVADGPAAALLAELAPNPPTLLTHPSVHSPFLAGIRRPAIFLPPAFAADFAPDALRAVFLHELAHRDRRDNLWTLAARLLTALLWFQPLLWLLGRKLEQISEDACDTAVLVQCPPRAYAACLLSLAERPPLARSQRTLTAGVAPFRSSLGRRIRHILTTQGVRPMPPLTLRLRLTAAALTLAAALGGAFLISSTPAQQAKPQYASVVGIWKVRTTATISDREVPYQNIYRFDSNKTGLYRIDMGKGPGRPEGHPEFHAACPFTWSEAADAIIINLPSGGADRVNEQQTGILSADRQALQITKSQWQLKLWSGSSWKLSEIRTDSGGLRLLRQSAQPKISSGTVVFVPGRIRGHGTLNNGTTVRQASAVPSAQLGQAQFLAGLTPVQGPGVVVTLTNSGRPFFAKATLNATQPNLIHAADIREIVGELKAAGAAAITVNDQRIIAASIIRPAGTQALIDKMIVSPTTQIQINKTVQNPPYIIQALGAPKTLTAALDKPHGLAARIKAFDFTMCSLRQSPLLRLPAYPGERPTLYISLIGAKEAQAQTSKQVAKVPESGGRTAQDQATAGTHTVAGYGLISFMQGKLLYCRAVKNSPASRLGLLISQTYQVFGVNGKPVPQSIAQFAEVCHAAPPLRLLLRPVLLKNFHGWKSHLVVFPAKSVYAPPSNPVTAESLTQEVQTAQEEAAKSKAGRGQIIQQLMDLIALALPQADTQTRPKALHLEERIGWSEDRDEFGKEYLAWQRKKHKIKSAAMASALEANAQSYLNPDLAEEAKLFPKTAETSQSLLRMHQLARKIGNLNMTVAVKQDQAQVITSLTRERSPDMSL